MHILVQSGFRLLDRVQVAGADPAELGTPVDGSDKHLGLALHTQQFSLQLEDRLRQDVLYTPSIKMLKRQVETKDNYATY